MAAVSRQLVEDGVCASAHNLQPVLSIYRWHGDIHERQEGRAPLHSSSTPTRCPAYPCGPLTEVTRTTWRGWLRRPEGANLLAEDEKTVPRLPAERGTTWGSSRSTASNERSTAQAHATTTGVVTAKPISPPRVKPQLRGE